jgi:hypothetical protein
LFAFGISQFAPSGASIFLQNWQSDVASRTAFSFSAVVAFTGLVVTSRYFGRFGGKKLSTSTGVKQSEARKYRCVKCGLVVEMGYDSWPDRHQGGECPAVSSNGNHDWLKN